MNVENLKRMVQYLRENVKPEQFDMAHYRDGDIQDPVCATVGCIIGHCTALDIENINNHFRSTFDIINFNDWSEAFTGMSRQSPEWNWCFSTYWTDYDNTIKGACKRIEFLIENPDEDYSKNNIANLYNKMGLKFDNNGN